MNYYPFHIGDYTTHTAHLDLLEDLAFRRLMDAYYLREAPLPADVAECARLVRMKQNIAEVETVLKEFFVLTNEGWMNVRCAEEIGKMKDKQAKAKASAQASVNARSANAQRTLNERLTDVELPTPTPTPTPIPTPVVSVASQPPAPKARRKQQYPADFFPNETGQAAATAKGIVIAIELEKFRDYHTAKGNTMADWQAAWRTWVGNSRPPAGSQAEPAWRVEQRKRTLQAVPSFVDRSANPIEFFDLEARNVAAITVG